MHQFIEGLSDQQTQDKILESSAAVEGGELSLTKVLKIAQAHKMGKLSQNQVNNGAPLSRLSEYQAKKKSSRQENRSRQETRDNRDKPKDNKQPSGKYCGNSGRKDRTSKLNDRREHCPAFDKSCSKCDTNGHFSHLCRGGPRDKRTDRSKSKSKPTVNEVKSDKKDEKDTKDTDDADLGTLSGSWLLINGIHSSPTPGASIYEVQDEFMSGLRYRNKAQLNAVSQSKVKKIKHHALDEFGKWNPSHVLPHGKVNVTQQSLLSNKL